jgi:tRNA uracil 4-sulfurtransferase
VESSRLRYVTYPAPPAEVPAPTAARTRILLRISGDVSTKSGGTLDRFSRRVAANVQDALSRSGIEYHLEQGRFRFMIEVDTPAALDVLVHVFGVQSVSRVDAQSWETFEDVITYAEAFFRDRVRGQRFAVRARRSGRTERIPFRSPEIERALGRALVPYADRVDLTSPEVTAYVDVRPGIFYLYEEKLAGPGGLPVGIEGHALALVSGGFDSAVAAWLMLKRGVALDYLFCNLGGDAHRQNVLRVLKVLAEEWSHGTRPRLFEIDFAPVVEELRKTISPKYWQIVLKRLMLRAAERLARKERALGLVTGEAMGQVSSQTLANLGVISNGLGLPVFRPVIGFNKDEIIAMSRDIGTFVGSAGAEEYCAILPRFPATHAEAWRIEAEEANFDSSRLQPLLETITTVDIRTVEPTSSEDGVELERIPQNATVLDLRSRHAYETWHAAGALHLEFFEALRSFGSFAPDRAYVLYCEVGQKSAHLAELMRRAGLRAFHVRGGVRTLLKEGHEHGLLMS